MMTLIVQPEIEHRDDRFGLELVVPEAAKAPRRRGLLREPCVEGEAVDEGDPALDQALHEKLLVLGRGPGVDSGGSAPDGNAAS